jgi:glycosyltransferase involved in cell wall biosynthesis
LSFRGFFKKKKLEYLSVFLKCFELPFAVNSMTLSPETVTKPISFVEPSLSLIVPVFNQQGKVAYSLEKIKQVVELAFSKYELIVVDDGSTDSTLDILKDIALTDEHIRILSYTPNRGKGYAVKQGVLDSHGDAVMFLDGDLDISPDSIKDYVEKLRTSDLVIASKRHPKSSVTIPRSRAFLSRAFHLLIRVVTGICQKDTQAGFKVGNGDIMRAIFRNITVNRYAFDVELLTIASSMYLKVQEMPVTMTIDRKFNPKEIVNMLVDVARISYKYRIAHHYPHEYLKKKKNDNIKHLATQ